MVNLGICKLCQEEKPLLKKSHIIQKALHKCLKNNDDQHFLVLSPTNPLNPYRVYDNMYEANILCRECDNVKLGKIENRGVRNFRLLSTNTTANSVKHYIKDEKYYIEVSGLNYKDLKLWLLLHLWRTSIARTDFFKEVSLGRKHEGILQSMILSEDPGLYNEYPFFTFSYTIENAVYRQTILPPICFRSNTNSRVYAIFLCGIVFCIYVNSKVHVLSEDIIRESKLFEDTGTLKIFNYSKKDFDSFMLRTFFHK